MKYHYEKPDVSVPLYGIKVILNNHPIYTAGTLYLENGKGIIVTQQYFDPETKRSYWDEVDPDIANDIYLSPCFKKFFTTFAKEKDYNIYQLRKIMWSLRMKPLKREPWENYFGATRQ